MPEASAPPSDDLRRFLQSLDQDEYLAWHDGVSYDLDALRRVSPAERGTALDGLLAKWRGGVADVQVLEIIGTEPALARLRRCAESGPLGVKLAATQALGRLTGEPDAVRDWLVSMFDDPALNYDEFIVMTSYLLAELQAVDGSRLRRAMIGCAARGGFVAPYVGSLLLQVTGISPNGFMWGSFPFLSRLDAADGAARAEAFTAFTDTLRRHGIEEA